MKKTSSTLILNIICLSAFSQTTNPYYTIPIQHDTAVQWAAECDKVVNLTPKISEFSLKKWYFNKLKKGTVAAYQKNMGSSSVSSYSLSMPGLQTQDWLKGLRVEVSKTKHPQEWYFIDNTVTGSFDDRLKYRGGRLNLAADSCCGCDDADAFRAKQVLSYKNGKFSIYNVFISPLCARDLTKHLFEWYPLCNLAYNDNLERKFPGPSKDVVLLNTNELDYDFEFYPPGKLSYDYDSVLTIYRTDIGSLIYQDVLKGRIKPIDIETGKSMPVNKFLTWKMPADTIPMYDVNDPSKITRYEVVQAERSSREFNRLRITQDLYFDFKNERLYSVIRSVVIILPVRSYDGNLRGYMQYCKIY